MKTEQKHYFAVRNLDGDWDGFELIWATDEAAAASQWRQKRGLSPDHPVAVVCEREEAPEMNTTEEQLIAENKDLRGRVKMLRTLVEVMRHRERTALAALRDAVAVQIPPAEPWELGAERGEERP